MNPLLQSLVDCAVDTLKTDPDGHIPTCVFLKDGCPQTVANYIYKGDKDRYNAYLELAQVAIAQGSDTVVLINEVWMRRLGATSTTADLNKRPEHCSDRIEALGIAVLSKTRGKDISITIPFTRNNLGVDLKEAEIHEDMDMAGMMGDVFHDAFDAMTEIQSLVDRLKAGEFGGKPKPKFDSSQFIKDMQARVKKEGGSI